MEHTVLIVDGDASAREAVELNLLRMGIDTVTASNQQEALAKVNKASISLCITEINLSDSIGQELIAHMQSHKPPIPIVIASDDVSVTSIVSAIKAGAYDYVQKPVDRIWLQDLLQQIADQPESTSSPNIKTITVNQDRIIGQSTVIQKLKNTIRKLARSQAPVYIQGESGSGKELVAHEIHHQGIRSKSPFIPVNCGAIPENLMESEFFGHKKGSFTGANTDKQGLFQAANGGTLFLDEVADLSLDMQVKLLRAIQEGAIKPVGGIEEIPVDVRILSATHKSLEDEVLQDRFRQDLYYRLNVIQVDVPPLRDRENDILLLADFFLTQIAEQWQLPVSRLTESAQKRLLDYDFPGNVRELENILERAYTLCENDEIDYDDLQIRHLKASQAHTMPATESSTSSPISQSDTAHEKEVAEAHDIWNPEDAHAERDLVLRALDYTRWNRTRAARILGMTFRQLSYRIQKYNLDENETL